MVAIWHHITISFKVLAHTGFIGTLIFLGEMHQWEVHWVKGCLLIGRCELNGLRGTSKHHKSSWHPKGWTLFCLFCPPAPQTYCMIHVPCVSGNLVDDIISKSSFSNKKSGNTGINASGTGTAILVLKPVPVWAFVHKMNLGNKISFRFGRIRSKQAGPMWF